MHLYSSFITLHLFWYMILTSVLNEDSESGVKNGDSGGVSVSVNVQLSCELTIIANDVVPQEWYGEAAPAGI